MIPEFYMYSAVPTVSGEKVTGYLCMRPAKDGDIDDYVSFIQLKDDPDCFVQVQVDTIEPVKVKPIMREMYNGRGEYFHTFPHCPHCDNILDKLKNHRFALHAAWLLIGTIPDKTGTNTRI